MSDEAAAPAIEPTNDAPPSDAGRSLLGDPGDFYKPKEPEAAEPEGKPAELEGHEPEGGDPEPEKRAEDDPAPEGEGVAEGDGEEGEPISTLSELMEANEWDPEWFDSLKVPVKVDGAPAEATMKDLVANYQMAATAEARLEKAKARVKAANDEITRHNEEAEMLKGIGSKMIKRVQDTLTEEMNAVDWTRLKEDDPGEYSARRLEFQERQAAIEQWKAEAREELEKTAAQHQEEQKEQRNKYLAQERALLLDAIPEWKDEKVAEAEKTEVAKFLMGRGFSQEDIFGAADHRLILIARESMLYNQMKSKSDTPKKRVLKTPTVVQPGSKVDQKPKPPAEKPTTELFYGSS